MMFVSEEQTKAVMRDIMALNEVKKAIAQDINEKLNNLAEVSAKIGELSASLKPRIHTEN